MKQVLLSTVVCLSAATAYADEDSFVASNILGILYHELGHAFIDLNRLPVFGQEEDAADVASILMIDAFFEEDDAVAIAYDAAFGFLGEAEDREASGEEVAWWDVHGPDLQRYYTLVCLFAGADLNEREDIAIELGLPDERLDTCEEEFELANDSWGPVFDDMSGQGDTFRYIGGSETLTEQVVSEEVAALNETFVLPQALEIRVESCGEANAFYDPNEISVIVCSEFEDLLRSMVP